MQRRKTLGGMDTDKEKKLGETSADSKDDRLKYETQNIFFVLEYVIEFDECELVKEIQSKDDFFK